MEIQVTPHKNATVITLDGPMTPSAGQALRACFDELYDQQQHVIIVDIHCAQISSSVLGVIMREASRLKQAVAPNGTAGHMSVISYDNVYELLLMLNADRFLDMDNSVELALQHIDQRAQ